MTGIIILAAGSSSRLGTPKQNLIYKKRTLLQRAVKAALATACGPVVVVLGANSEIIRPTIEGLPIDISYNENWQEGMSSSIRSGISQLQKIKARVSSVILMLCDQPFVNTQLLQRLIPEDVQAKNIAACAYNGTVGPPVFFDGFYFPELLLLKGSEGAKKLLLKHAAHIATIPFPLGGVDIDTMEDFEGLKKQ